jgi:hypothetical protein
MQGPTFRRRAVQARETRYLSSDDTCERLAGPGRYRVYASGRYLGGLALLHVARN